MIEQIEGIHAELNRYPVTDFPVFVERQVCTDKAWAMAVAARRCVGIKRSQVVAQKRDGIRIDDLVSTLAARASLALERALIADQACLEQSSERARTGR